MIAAELDGSYCCDVSHPSTLTAIVARWGAIVGFALAVVWSAGAGTANAIEVPGETTYRGPRTVKIMPLGDSVTSGNGWQGPNSYRGPLAELANRFGTKIDFVGGELNPNDTMADRDQEAFGGDQTQDLDAKLARVLSTYRPDVILLHTGTNNIWRDGEMPTTAPRRLSELVDHITSLAPDVWLYVASIGPSAEHERKVRVFNEAVPKIVDRERKQGKRVRFVDMHAALDYSDLVDGIHPDAEGYKIMAEEWWLAMNPPRRAIL